MTSSYARYRLGPPIADGIVTSLANDRRNQPPSSRRVTLALQSWRLSRVQKYVRTHISNSIRLADLANVAGFTRMYFAAQFRARTGIRPHEYVIRERIARAQTLLMMPQNKTVEVSLSVGFASQAHFTTVFRRYVGITPHRWRVLQNTEDGATLRRPVGSEQVFLDPNLDSHQVNGASGKRVLAVDPSAAPAWG
jgi:AraC-like DNA-binding protein